MTSDAPRLVRKAAYGRTQLFLPSASTIVREVKCMGGVTRHDAASVYHVLPDAAAGFASACWHCCEEIGDDEGWVPLPRLYDPVDKVYHVYGKTCGPSCAKAYVLEHTTFDRGQHLNVLVKMLREVYGIEGPVVETPPRPALRRFGGAFDPRACKRAECRLVEPPFVTYSMLVEERVGGGAAATAEEKETLAPEPVVVEEAYDLDEPPAPALFAAYAARQTEPPRLATQAAMTGHKRREPPPPTDGGGGGGGGGTTSASAAALGPLSKFVRRR
jgi:hypothetical protein